MTMHENKRKGSALNILPYILSAILALIVGCVMYSAKSFYPFGDRCVMSLDLSGQYYGMYVNNKLSGLFSDFLYSWNGAFGFNNWAQSAYYCNSIFLFFFRFIKPEFLPNAIDIFCLLKVMLAAPSCLALLRRHAPRKNSPALIACAVAYASCNYMLAYSVQFMWTDVLIYTPLVLLGIDRLIHEKKPLLYTVMLAVTLISSFYIGFALCIFSVLWFLCHAAGLLSAEKGKKLYRIVGWKPFFGSALRFGVYSLIAGALAAVVLIPVWMVIQQTIASELAAPDEFEWYGTISNVLRDLLPEQTLHMEYFGANLFCGTVMFLAVPLYFLNPAFKIRERISDGILLAVMLVSLNNNFLNYIWHGFHFPNQLPMRFSFLVSLLLVMLCGKGLSAFDALRPNRVIPGCALGVLLFYLGARGVGDSDATELTAFPWVILFVLAGLLILGSIIVSLIKREELSLGKHKLPAKRTAAAIAVTVVSICMVFDSGRNYVHVSKYEGSLGVFDSELNYHQTMTERHVRNGLEHKSGSDTFFRTEANSGYSFNSSMVGDYHGMRYYSSTMNGDLFRFLKFLGNRVYADKVSSVYTLSSPVQNSLFALKQVMDFDRNLDQSLPGTVITEETEDAVFRENPDALSLGYAVSDQIVRLAVTDEVRALRNQNALLSAMYGETIEPFVRMENTVMESEGVQLLPNDNWESNQFVNDNNPRHSVFRYKTVTNFDGDYYFEHNFRAGTMHIMAPNLDKSVDARLANFYWLGNYPAGTEINIEITIDDVQVGCYGLDFYRFDNDAWRQAHDRLAAHQFEVTHFANTCVEGSISLPQKELVFFSVPQDGGWSVYCDGNKIATRKVCGIMLCADIPMGDHKVVLKYRVPGMTSGAVISGLALCVLVLIQLLNRRRAKKAAVPAQTEPTSAKKAADAEPDAVKDDSPKDAEASKE